MGVGGGCQKHGVEFGQKHGIEPETCGWGGGGRVGDGWGVGGMGSGGERGHRVESGVEDRAVGGMGLGTRCPESEVG